MKKHIKIIFILLLLITIFIAFNEVYAATCSTCHGTGEHPTAKGLPCVTCGGRGSIPESLHTAGEIMDEAGEFIDVGEQGANNKISEESLQNLSNTLYNILLVVGIIVAIIVGLVMGIKFIMGSIEDKAEIKTMLIPYVIGCVVVFGAFAIWQIVVNLLQSM